MLLPLLLLRISILNKGHIMFSTSILICLTALSMNMRNADVICENALIIQQMSEKYDFDPTLISSVGRNESAWTPTARIGSHAC